MSIQIQISLDSSPVSPVKTAIYVETTAQATATNLDGKGAVKVEVSAKPEPVREYTPDEEVWISYDSDSDYDDESDDDEDDDDASVMDIDEVADSDASDVQAQDAMDVDEVDADEDEMDVDE